MHIAIPLLVLSTTGLLFSESPCRDTYGDPLPEGAVARFGSSRLHAGQCAFVVAFSPDGARIAGSGSDSFVRVWDAASGASVAELRGHAAGGVMDLEFGPDGRTLVSAGRDETVRIWDLSSGKELRRIEQKAAAVDDVALSPDGKLLVVPTWVGRIHLYDATSGEEIGNWRAHQSKVSSVEFSEDGERLLTGSWDETVRLWDVDTRKQVWQAQTKNAAGKVATFAQDGHYVLCAGEEHPIEVLDAETGKPIEGVRVPETPACGVAARPGGPMVVCLCGTTDYEITATIWDLSAGKALRTLRRRGVSVNAAAFSPDGKTLATADHAGYVRLWNPDTGEELFHHPGHQGGIRSTAWSGDGLTVATGGGDGTVRLWDAKTGREMQRLQLHVPEEMPRETPEPTEEAGGAHTLRRFVPKYTGRVDSVTLSHDATHVAAAGDASHARVWETMSGREVAALPLQLTIDPVVCFLPGGRKILACVSERGAAIWDIDTGELADLAPGQAGIRRCRSAVSLDGQRIAMQGTQGEIQIWDSVLRKEVMQIECASGPVQNLAFSPNGRLLATATAKERLVIWEVASGKLLFSATGKQSWAASVSFSSDGRFIATSLGGGPGASIWDVDAGAEAVRLQGHDGVVALEFAPRRCILLTAGMDDTAMVWDCWKVPGEGPGPTIEEAWEALSGSDAARAFRAQQALLASPQEAIRVLRERLRPVHFDPERVQEWIATLGGDNEAARSYARAALLRIRFDATDALRKAMETAASVTLRQELRSIIDAPYTLIPNPSGDALATLRAVQVLESIGDAGAEDMLEAVAAGAPKAAETRAARAALTRIRESR